MEITEKLYSVVLDEEELALFSDFQERLYGKTDLIEGITKFPGYTKFVSGGKELTPEMKGYIKKFVREKRANRIADSYNNSGIQSKISRIDRKLRKKSGKTIDAGGYLNLI